MKLQLPKLSATMDAGRIALWCKKPGDEVSEGEVLYELETDKTVLPVESAVGGILDSILVAEGEEAPAGADVCVIRTIDESISVAGDSNASGNGSAPSDGRMRASPSSRRLARELSVDIEFVAGSGPEGRIRNRDVERAAAERTNRADAAGSSAAASGTAMAEAGMRLQSSAPSAVPTAVPSVSPMRRAIARELTRSQQTIPVFWLEKWVHAEELLRWRELLMSTEDYVASPLTVTDFLLQAIGQGLERHPEVNRVWREQGGTAELVAVDASHVGLAVSLEDGILVPTIERAGRSSLFSIAARRRAAVEEARGSGAWKAGPSAAITLSNLGAAGIDRFRAIVRPDESMILAVGAIREKVVAENGVPAVRKGFTLTLACDHRVIDGKLAAAFLSAVSSCVERGSWRLSD